LAIGAEDVDSRPHTLRLLGTVDVLGFASIGLLYAFDSGGPAFRRFTNEVTGGADNYRATPGVNPGTNIGDPADDRALRTPSIERMNLQLRARLKRLIRADVDLYADVINIREWSYIRKLTDASPADAMPGPHWFRFGLCFRN